MGRLVPVTDSLLSVRDDAGVPTGIMVFPPVHEVGGKLVAVGATTKDGSNEYGVVIGSKMLKKHRSPVPIPPHSISIAGEGSRATVYVGGVRVKTLKIA